MANTQRKTETLVYGFIREIEVLLPDQIIPESINAICWMYYYLNKLLFCITSDNFINSDHIYIADINVQNGKKNLFFSGKTNIEPWSVYLSGFCVATEFTSFPSSFLNKYNEYTSNIIFKCGGWTHHTSGLQDCHAIIINTDTFNMDTWTLPSLPYGVYANSISFSCKHQTLISIGGNSGYNCNVHKSNHVYSLDFNENNNNNNNNNDDDEWKWKELNSMKGNAYNAASIFIDKYDKLMVVDSGKDNDHFVEIYDTEKNEWQYATNCRFGRNGSGICYHPYKDEVFIGGGYDNMESKTVEQYDFHKNKWNLTTIPVTKYEHVYFPAMWVNNNLLYIANISNESKTQQSLECIDLRVCMEWNTIYDGNLLSNIFGIDDDMDEDSCALLVN